MTGQFETPQWHHEKALKALKVAKKLESQKRAQGARFIRKDEKTWVLKQKTM